jgi:hypothetical protein
VAQCLRHCATNRKVAGSIPDCDNGFFHWHNPSGSTMALGSTQTLTENKLPEIFPGGKDGRCVVLINLPTSCSNSLKIWESQTPATLRACQGLQWDCFSFGLRLLHLVQHNLYVLNYCLFCPKLHVSANPYGLLQASL